MAAPVGASEALDPNTPQEPHPKGLYILFMTEMWERFSYYGMRALLVPYMISAAFGYQPREASGVYKWYTSLVYLTPLLGGLLADRLLGLRNAVLIGAVLMAVGHILMAFPSHTLFFAALAFLIVGNGMFKPNISTMIGRLYTPNDSRRDRAFTIFYMGINLGAFLAGILCDWLRVKFGFHYGFGAAGVGMMVGLLVFGVGQKRVAQDAAAVGNSIGNATAQAALQAARENERAEKAEADRKEPFREGAAPADAVVADADAPSAGGVASILAKAYPVVMILAAIGIVTTYGLKVANGEEKPISLIMPIAFGAVFVTMAGLLFKLRNREKDKSVSIFIMFLFPVLFWMAFEQAGNALNFWATDHTDLHVGGFEYPAGWWQSVNSLLIFALAPVFTVVWAVLARAKKEPSTPMKMFGALFLMILSFVAMVFGAASENAKTTSVALTLPANSTLDPAKVPFAEFNAGRLSFEGGKISARGVLPDYAVRKVLESTAPQTTRDFVKKVDKDAEAASAEKPTVATLAVPAWFEVPLDDSTKELKLKATTPDKLAACEVAIPVDASVLAATTNVACGPKVLLAWGGGKLVVASPGPIEPLVKSTIFAQVAEPEWKKALLALAKESHSARVSGFWLFLSYLLATLGELCLSPVGISMVTKLAPPRFAGLFMGVWLLSSSVAQYAGGSVGERWGEIPPQSYFMIFVGTSIVGSILALLLAFPLRKLMHDVK